MADRVRMNTVALATTALAQSPSFWHAGNDLLRSKSLDRNSYDSGDWFNRIDWSGQESTFGSGLPPAPDNQAKWDFMRPLLADPALKPAPTRHRGGAARAPTSCCGSGSPRRCSGSAARGADPATRVSFPSGGPGQTPGVIVMAIDDRPGATSTGSSRAWWSCSTRPTRPRRQTVASLAGRRYRAAPGAGRTAATRS